ncbi:MAG: hypothetical protein M3Z65_01575 [Chloroflexota bacterium]|nr:hypothetical protein [Chloroflexota bacterium]
MTYFREEQRFRDSWLWLAIAIPMAIAVFAVLTRPNASVSAAIVVVGVTVAVAALIGLARLETEVTAEAVVVRFHGLWPTRRIPLAEIAEYAPMHYSMWDSGGWGVHLGLAGMTYNVSGNEGIHFVLKRGAKVLVGTQHPAEFAAGVAKALETTTTR